MTDIAQSLIQQLANAFIALPQVEAVALSGSRANSAVQTDPDSDIDLYVYTRSEVPLVERQRMVELTGGASRADLGLNYWGPGDEWYNLPTGIEVDIVYFDVRWMEEQIERVLVRHESCMGYTTCFWHTVNQSALCADPRGWFSALQTRCQTNYPEELRRNIIALNHPTLHSIIPSYAHQVEKAVKRGDLVSINHRLAALFASYFDIQFALNRQTHPGEKRMLEQAVKLCSLLPQDFETDVEAVLETSTSNIDNLPQNLNRMINHLDDLLKHEGFLPSVQDL